MDLIEVKPVSELESATTTRRRLTSQRVRRNHPSMGRPKTDNTKTLLVRVPERLLERMDALVALSPEGQSSTRADVARMALFRGVTALEGERDAKAESKPRGRK
jgi:hypothetical protein